MQNQIFVLGVIAVSFGLFLWGRPRYDLVGLTAIVVLALGGVLPTSEIFHGFANDAVLSVVAVMIAGRALRVAGITEPFAVLMLRVRGTSGPVLALTGTAAFFSAMMNNTGALAVFLPVAVHMSRTMRRLASSLLMPLAFASLLGGLVTLIGTPPNILVSAFRKEHLGEPYALFDYTPVGLGVALVGLLFLGLVGWRLLPPRRGSVSMERLLQMERYFSELHVPRRSSFVGHPLRELATLGLDVNVVGIVRGRVRLPAPGADEIVQAGDVLLVEAAGEPLRKLLEATGFEMAPADESRESEVIEGMGSEDVLLEEVVIARGSPLVGRTAKGLRMRWRFGVNLLAISRRGERIVRRLSEVRFRPGDVILLQVRRDALPDVMEEFKVFSLVDHEHPALSLPKLGVTVGIFSTAVILVATGTLPLGLTFLAAALLLVMVGVVDVRQAYTAVDWPVIILLGSTICMGAALEYTGAAELIARGLIHVADDWSPPVLVGMVMLTTMLISNLINNAATAVMMAPIAYTLAMDLGHSPDTFLMAVAVGASSCFLTPIAHQCNILVLGPGGYRWGDYLRLGLPLSVLVLGVGLFLILRVWPL